MAPELETARLRFRDWRESDVDPFHAFYRDPQSEAVYGTDAQRSDAWRRMALFVGHWQLRGYGPWALEDKKSGRKAGMIPKLAGASCRNSAGPVMPAKRRPARVIMAIAKK